MLEAMFSGWLDSRPLCQNLLVTPFIALLGRHNLKKVGDRFFIDRDPKLFRYVMSYLRTRKLDLPEEASERAMVLHEFDYFCINASNPSMPLSSRCYI